MPYNNCINTQLPKINLLIFRNMKFELIPKWRVKSHPHIKLTSNRKCYNSKTGRLKKITVNGGSVGIWLDSKTFLSKSKLKENIELIPKKEYCPF